MSIGSRVKEQRKISNMTQSELALKLGMSLDSIKKIETNRVKPSVETLDKLSEIFSCSSDYLLGKTDISKILSEDERQIIKAFYGLSEKDRNFIFEMIEKIK